MGEISEIKLRGLFETYGSVLGVKIYTDETEMPKGDALITMANADKAAEAIRGLNGKQVKKGFRIKVQQPSFSKAKTMAQLGAGGGV